MSALAGRSIIVTGASSGIGKATAVNLVKLGAAVMLADLDEVGLGDTLRQCELASSERPIQQHTTFTLDVRSSDKCNELARAAVARFGAINGVFNCAGINPTKMNIDQISDTYWHKLIDTNLKGLFSMTRACVPFMTSGDSFVNVSSVCGLYPTENLSVYCAAKYGVIGFSKCMALELGPRGIRVNVLAPGNIATQTNVSVRAGKEQMEKISRSIGLKRFGTAEEVASVAAFLFSRESQYMNGGVLEIAGGMGASG